MLEVHALALEEFDDLQLQGPSRSRLPSVGERSSELDELIEGVEALPNSRQSDGVLQLPEEVNSQTDAGRALRAVVTEAPVQELLTGAADEELVEGRFGVVPVGAVPGGDGVEPYGKYLVALNKITKDRYLPTGPELTQSAQLFDISGDKMKLLLDFPTVGEPHYAEAIPAALVKPKSKKFYKIEDNHHPYVTKSEKDTRVVREGKVVHVYMTAIRSHLAPDNIEGVKLGDEVYFHVTNLEQDWDVPHGFAVKGSGNSELLIMPGETATLKYVPGRIGIAAFYCTDFCSALHQEMQGYLRVSPAGSDVPLKSGMGESASP